MPGPDFPQINASLQTAVDPSPAPTPDHLARTIMYALQGADAMNSANKFRTGLHETDPLMKPFSHGGAPMMALGFGLIDMMRQAMMKHASPGTQNTADALQGLSNLAGIMQTNSARMTPGVAPPAAPSPAPRIAPGPTRSGAPDLVQAILGGGAP